MGTERYEKNVPPSTAMIQSMIDADISLKVAIAELIDNSLDQDATQIDISLNAKVRGLEEIIVSDNGKGCFNLELMVQLGSHVATKKSAIGRYGVGFKDATIWLGDCVFVDSFTKSGKKEQAEAYWNIMMTSGKWNVAFKDASERVSRGVTIRISDLRRHRVNHGWKYVPGYITELFSAAIDAGVVITVDGKRVKSVPRPLLIDDREFLIKFDGKVAKGICGILVDKSVPSGWNVRYDTRTIVSKFTREGFGTYSSQGFWGMLYMIDDEKKWRLTRNKNASEDLASILECRDMQAVVVPLLEKLATEDQKMNMSLSQNLVTDELNRMLKKIKSEDDDISLEKKDSEKSEEDDKVMTDHRSGRGKDKSERKKGEKKDALSQSKKLLQGINCITIRRVQGDGKSLGKAELRSRETLLIVEVDESNDIGKNICGNAALLRHTAITLIALLFGTREDIGYQLTFSSLSAVPHVQDKISRINAWLLRHVNFDDLKVSSDSASL